ncbi:hypothetical protein HID58_016628, partial [Brassica napus]
INKIVLHEKMTANSRRNSNASIKLSQQSDVSTQSAPRNIVETKSVASSGPERAATQDSKTVIDMDEHFHLMFGRETLLNKEVVDEKVRFSKQKYASGDEGDPGEPIGLRPTYGEMRCGGGRTPNLFLNRRGLRNFGDTKSSGGGNDDGSCRRGATPDGCMVSTPTRGGYSSRESSKPMLMQNGDCNRRETRRVGEPPQNISDPTLSETEHQVGELAYTVETNCRQGKRKELKRRSRRRRPEASPASKGGGCKRVSIIGPESFRANSNYRLLMNLS